MILIDTSAWIDFLRDQPVVLTDVVEAALDSEAAICDAISMEVLAGARDERHLLLHSDRDFTTLARHTDLRVHPASLT